MVHPGCFVFECLPAFGVGTGVDFLPSTRDRGGNYSGWNAAITCIARISGFRYFDILVQIV